MHKLDRNGVTAPECLNGYDYRMQNWEDLHQNCKREVRQRLEIMQGCTLPNALSYVRCAYCEAQIHSGGHIEHFRRKNRNLGFPQYTFSWQNLFLSCDDKNHCGHFKDRNGNLYDPNHLIKPDAVDPETYLYFHSNGKVRPRPDLLPPQTLLAHETIRILGLDDGTLTYSRAMAVKPYLKLKEGDFEEIATWDEELRQEYFRQEIDQTHCLPFATTIRHFLMRFC